MYYTKINIEKKQADCSVYLIWWKARYVYVILLSFFSNLVSWGKLVKKYYKKNIIK